LITLLLILIVDSLVSNNFFNIRIVTDLENGQHFYGDLIDIVKNSAPIILLAIGMALVIATKGIDLSVGAVMAICGLSPPPWSEKRALSPFSRSRSSY